MSEIDPDVRVRELAGPGHDPTAWFEQLYVEAGAGTAVVPWDRGAPHPLLVERFGDTDGTGRTAMVVGCGLGNDAEYLSGLGYAVTAFDVSPTAVAQARARYPDSTVTYEAADLLALPARWREAFDLVVEIMTVQSMPRSVRGDAIVNIAAMVAPAGTLFYAGATPPADRSEGGPPWPLTRAEVAAFADDARFRTVRLDEVPREDEPSVTRWVAEFRAG